MDKNLTVEDASVICRELNSSRDVSYPICCSKIGVPTAPVLLLEPSCNGSEQSIVECAHAGWADHNLTREYNGKYGIGVMCLERDASKGK